MPKTKPVQSPGTTLKLFLREYHLNPTSLAKGIQLSQASIRLMTLDRLKISVKAALRLAKYFNMKPEYWLNLQNTYDMSVAAKDAELNAILKKIPVAKKTALDEKNPAARKPVKKTASKAAAKAVKGKQVQ